jgi:hypothetical protein
VFKFFGKRNTAALAALVVAGVAGVGAYAFTATNSVPAENAGAGLAKVSHFTATKVSYTFSADTTTVTAIGFDLSGTVKPTDVAVDLEAHGATPDKTHYVHCDNASTVADGAGEWAVTCPGLTFSNTGDVNGDNDLYIAAVTSGTVNLS